MEQFRRLLLFRKSALSQFFFITIPLLQKSAPLQIYSSTNLLFRKSLFHKSPPSQICFFSQFSSFANLSFTSLPLPKSLFHESAPSQICSFAILLLHKSAPSQIAEREIGMRSQLRAPPLVRKQSRFQLPNIQTPSDHAMTFVYPRSSDRGGAVAAQHGEML